MSVKRAFTVVETLVLVGSVCLVTMVGASAHRWMWAQAELVSCRTAMRDLAHTVRSLAFHAASPHRVVELRVDALKNRWQLVEVQSLPGGRIESVRRTAWLPETLEVLDAPAVMSASPSGELPAASIVVTAPAYDLLFRLTTSPSGGVRLDEEPST